MNLVFVLKAGGITLLICLIIFAVSLFELWTQLARYKAYWDRNNTQPPISGEILYIAMGDSTAQGIGASHPEKSYPGVIKNKLADGTQRPVRLVNISKSGAKIRDVIDKQLPELEKLGSNEKTIITIEIGANNMISYNEKKFEAEMDELMGSLPEQAVLSDIPYFGGSRLKSREADVLSANKIMYRLASKHVIELVPLHSKIKNNNGIKMYAADWFHPSNTSYRENWAPVFLDSINTENEGVR